MVNLPTGLLTTNRLSHHHGVTGAFGQRGVYCGNSWLRGWSTENIWR